MESAGDKGKPKVWLVVGVLDLLHRHKRPEGQENYEAHSAQANLPMLFGVKFGVKRETESASSPSKVTSRGQREWGVKMEHSWEGGEDMYFFSGKAIPGERASRSRRLRRR